MKKIIISLFLNLVMSSVLFAESYYFNRCKLSDILSANYSIDLSEKMINIKLEAADGSVQKFSDPIGLIEKDKITSKKIKSRNRIGPPRTTKRQNQQTPNPDPQWISNN